MFPRSLRGVESARLLSAHEGLKITEGESGRPSPYEIMMQNFGSLTAGRMPGGLFEEIKAKIVSCKRCQGAKTYEDYDGPEHCRWCRGSGIEPERPPVKVVNELPEDGFSEGGC